MSEFLKKYFLFKTNKTVKKGYWNLYKGLSGLLGQNRGIFPLVHKIRDGFLSNYFLSLNQRNDLLKNIFTQIVSTIDKDIKNIELVTNYTEACPEIIIRLARSHASTVRDKRVRAAILNSIRMKDYISELLQIWNFNNVDFSPEGESNSDNNLNMLYRNFIGSKNSAPMHLVKEMYALQAKGCPPPSNKNSKNDSDNDFAE